MADKLCKESLKGDGQQFHQYQQNEQVTLTHRTQSKTMTYDAGNPSPGLGQA